jgi:hypothetical protein
MHNLFLVYFVNLHMFQMYLGPSSIVVYIWLYLPMMGLDTPETCGGWRNIRGINCASSWFFFTQLYWDTQSIKHKIYGWCRDFKQKSLRKTEFDWWLDVNEYWKLDQSILRPKCAFVLVWALWNISETWRIFLLQFKVFFVAVKLMKITCFDCLL